MTAEPCTEDDLHRDLPIRMQDNRPELVAVATFRYQDFALNLDQHVHAAEGHYAQDRIDDVRGKSFCINWAAASV